jgi:transposase-like protein
MAEAPTAADARAARERFRTEFDAKYPKATAKLDAFPAEHWRHLKRPTPSRSSIDEKVAV